MTKLGFLKKILPPEEKIFYELFQKGAQVSFEIAQTYNKILKEGLSEQKLEEITDLKHKAVLIDKETLLKLGSTFITPIDREDIQLISSLLKKISKRTVRACINLRVYRFDVPTEHMISQSQTLIEATTELVNLLTKFKETHEINAIAEINNRMDEIETTGDKILYLAMDELFSGNHDALTVIKLRDIYKNIENALDSCFSVSDTLLNVVIKHN
ncbi:MAG: DUF47 family protein [Cyanobacteriota bacterium]